MSDVGHISSNLATVQAQQQIATTVLGLAQDSSKPVQELLDAALAQAKGAAEAGKGQHVDHQA